MVKYSVNIYISEEKGCGFTLRPLSLTFNNALWLISLILKNSLVEVPSFSTFPSHNSNSR